MARSHSDLGYAERTRFSLTGLRARMRWPVVIVGGLLAVAWAVPMGVGISAKLASATVDLRSYALGVPGSVLAEGAGGGVTGAQLAMAARYQWPTSAGVPDIAPNVGFAVPATEIGGEAATATAEGVAAAGATATADVLGGLAFGFMVGTKGLQIVGIVNDGTACGVDGGHGLYSMLTGTSSTACQTALAPLKTAFDPAELDRLGHSGGSCQVGSNYCYSIQSSGTIAAGNILGQAYPGWDGEEVVCTLMSPDGNWPTGGDAPSLFPNDTSADTAGWFQPSFSDSGSAARSFCGDPQGTQGSWEVLGVSPFRSDPPPHWVPLTGTGWVAADGSPSGVPQPGTTPSDLINAKCGDGQGGTFNVSADQASSVMAIASQMAAVTGCIPTISTDGLAPNDLPVTVGGGVIADPTTTDAYRQWVQTYPQCTLGGCQLDLQFQDDTGTWTDCWDSPSSCLGWKDKDPSGFRCQYNLPDGSQSPLALQECLPYVTTWDPSTAPWSDPKTGDTDPSLPSKTPAVVPAEDPSASPSPSPSTGPGGLPGGTPSTSPGPSESPGASPSPSPSATPGAAVGPIWHPESDPQTNDGSDPSPRDCADGSTGCTGDPKPLDAGSPQNIPNCMEQLWNGLFNPINWVLVPVKCAMQWAFVPDAAATEGEIKGMSDDMRGTFFGKIASSAASMFDPAVLAALGGGGCQGPAFELKWGAIGGAGGRNGSGAPPRGRPR